MPVGRDSLEGYLLRSCELPQEPQIVRGEITKVRNAEQDHREPVHAETEGKAAPLLRIVSLIAAHGIDLLVDGGMHHAAAAHLQPLLAASERLRFHVHFEARFSERKIMRPKTNLSI